MPHYAEGAATGQLLFSVPGSGHPRAHGCWAYLIRGPRGLGILQMDKSPTNENKSTAGSHRRGNLAWAAAVLVVALLAVYAFGGLRPSSSSSFSQTTSTAYSLDASSVITAAVQGYPAGYNATSAGLLSPSYPGVGSAAYALMSQTQSSANLTVIVFDTDNASQSYFSLFQSNVKGLAGYTDITSVLAGYEQYGACYAYGDDVDGIAVANGICTDGNVFLQVHLSSTESFSQAQSDLASLMGAMYQSVD